MHAATTIVAAALSVLVLVGCGGDDDTPPDPSDLAVVQRVLCEQARATGDTTVVIDGRTFDLSDCLEP